MSEHETCHAIGQRRLADARRSADQPGMGNAAAFVSIEQRALGIVVTEQHVGFARAQDFPVGIVVTHGVVVSARRGCGLRRSTTVSHIRPDTMSRGARPSMTTQRLGSLSASAE